MECLFSPCTRFHDILVSELIIDPHEDDLQELNLDVSTEDFLSSKRAFTYADLYAMSNENAVLWLTPHAFVVLDDTRNMLGYCGEMDPQPFRYRFRVDGKDMNAIARSPEHILEICDVILRLLAASVVHSVFLCTWNSVNHRTTNVSPLAYLMEKCQSLKVLTLSDVFLDENHIRVLGTYSRSDLDIELVRCALTTNAGSSALVEVLRRNQGPTKLDCCDIDNFLLASGLRGNSRLKSLKPYISGNPEFASRQVLAIAGAVKQNKGLVELDLIHEVVSDEVWDAICDSLKTHPTLQVIGLRSRPGRRLHPGVAPVSLEARIQALVDILKVNNSIRAINFTGHHDMYTEHELYEETVIPYLETNRFRPRLLAIQKSRPIAYRAKVLGRALLAVQTDPNRFWMLLSGNVEVAFPSTSATTIAPAAILPTPATTDITVTASRAASATGASTADIVATPASGQKRKARP
jgi:hypothetical protein